MEFPNKISVKHLCRTKVTCCGNDRKEPVWVLSPPGGSKSLCSIVGEGYLSLTSTGKEKNCNLVMTMVFRSDMCEFPLRLTLADLEERVPSRFFPFSYNFGKLTNNNLDRPLVTSSTRLVWEQGILNQNRVKNPADTDQIQKYLHWSNSKKGFGEIHLKTWQTLNIEWPHWCTRSVLVSDYV